MEKLNEKTLSKIYASYIGAKIELCQSRFSEDQEDRIFTLDGVCSDGFYVKEIEGVKYKFESNDSILIKEIDSVIDEDAIQCLKIAYKCVFGYTDGIEKCDILTEDEQFGAICFNKKFNNERISITVGKCVEFWVDGKELIINQLHIYQYLQSKCYAFPHMDYSVNDLIELGVYKIIK